MIYTTPSTTETFYLDEAPTGLTGTIQFRIVPVGSTTPAVGPQTTGITEVSSGRYKAVATTPATVGDYLPQWVNGSTVVDDEVLRVAGSAAAVVGTPYFTVAEARTLKPLDNATTYPDANIDATRLIAEQALEDACGVAFVPRTQTETLSGNGTNYLLPSRPRAQTVTAVTVAGTVYAGTDLTNLTVDEGGRIYNPLIWTQGTQGNITITYTHGYTSIPLRVKRAAMYLTRRWLVDGPFDEQGHVDDDRRRHVLAHHPRRPRSGDRPSRGQRDHRAIQLRRRHRLMPVSTAPAVKAALLTQLGARAGLLNVGLNWSAPVDAALYAPSGEDIYLGDVDQTQEYRRLGTLIPKDEHYTVQVIVQVHRAGNDPEGTEQRCWALVGEVENQLRSDPAVNNTIVPAQQEPYAQFESAAMVTRPSEPQGWLAKATCRVAVGARI
jgi:hypothetical protein